MAARKRTQEEKNLRTLRELASLPANKQCFDCHQRGPTYVNMLVGSFVCTSCSGMLRGLNPPHRVKSITMTVFTPEEVEFVRSRGNDYCRQVWLGLYDPRSLLEPESRDEQKVKDFMIQKYERKRWYVSPENVTFRSQQSTAPPAAAAEQHVNSQPQQLQYPLDTKPATALSAKEPGSLVIHSPPQAPTSTWTKANSNLNYNSLNNNNNNNTTSRLTTAVPPGNKGLDLLSEFGADPFAPAPSPAQAQHPVNHNASPPASQPPASQVSYSSANGNFANFESAFSDTTSSGSSGFTPEASGNASFAVFQNNVISPPPPILSRMETSKVEAPPPADRYAALADLDNLFHAQQDTNTLTSSNGPSPPPTTVQPASTSVSSTTPWAVNNTTSALQMKQIPNTNYGQPFSAPNPFQTTVPSTDSWNSVSQQPHPTAQKQQQQTHMYNPFQQQQQQQQGFVYSPYTGAPTFSSMDNFGTMGPQHGMFNPYLVGAAQAPGSATGDLGSQVPQYVMQNGGSSGPPFSPGPWTGGQGHSASWMQPMSNKVMFPSVEAQANPFMTNAAAPKLNPGNPFL